MLTDLVRNAVVESRLGDTRVSLLVTRSATVRGTKVTARFSAGELQQMVELMYDELEAALFPDRKGN